MGETIKFRPEAADAIKKQQERIERLKEKGGFLFEEKDGKNLISFLGLREGIGGKPKDCLVEIKTKIKNEKEMQEIPKEVKQTPLFRKILTFIAETYNQERIPLIQSVPGTGKTFAYLKFNELRHGKEAPLEYLSCTPRTSELDIIGHWTPKGAKREEIEEILAKDKEWPDFIKGFQKNIENLVSKKDVLGEEEFQKKWGELHQNYAAFQKERLFPIFKKEESNWVFRKGALLAGFKDPTIPEDEGRVVVIDEIDNLPENYQNIFLQISGKGSRLTETITAYSDSGTTKYKKGENTFLGFAANYPELALGKRSISGPLADRLDWLSITPKESLKDENLRIEKYSFDTLKEKFEKSDPKIRENLRFILSRSLAVLHTQWKKVLSDYRKEGLELPEGKTRYREQEKEFSQRTVVGFEDTVLSHIDDPAYLNPKTGTVNLSELFIDAFQAKYLNFLASDKLKIKFTQEQLLPLIYGGRKQLLETDKGIEIKEMPELRESPFLYIKEDEIFRPYDSQKDKNKKMFAFDEVLDSLIEKISGVGEKLTAEEKKREKFKARLTEAYRVQDKLEKDLEDLRRGTKKR